MRKVVNIDLGGRAYQVDEEGYELLQKYLARAEKQLANNPDKAEVLHDIESAIATKVTADLKSGQTVLKAAAIQTAIEEVGPVETEATTSGTSEDSKTAEVVSRKLYLLPKEGKIAGVCAGLAAYFGMDVTLMRVLFVLMLFITQGFWLLVYIVLAIAMPKAETAAQAAEAHGKPVTAQEIVTRIKQDVPADSVEHVGRVLSAVARMAARILAIVTAVIIGFLATVWGWGLWAVSLSQTTLTGNLAEFGRFEQLALVTALFVVVALPLLALFRLFERVARTETDNPSQKTILPIGFWILWGVLAVMINGFTFAAVEPVRSNVNANDGYLKIGKHALCIDESKCAEPRSIDTTTERQNW
jgi:phage shock protein PspC (stress-responsive transcriptional regulator)